MKFLSIIPVTLAIGLSSTIVFAADYDFKLGLWETTTIMDVKGAPPQMAAMMKLPPQVEQECINSVDEIFESDTECKYEKKRISANKMQINFKCVEDGDVMIGKGGVSFNGKALSSWTEMKTQGSSGPMTVTYTTSGKYLGACK